LAKNSSGKVTGSVLINTTVAGAPTVTILQDTDNNGYISKTEINDQIDVRVTAPVGAVVGDTISTKAQAVASSNAAIAEAGHTLVLGWNAAAGVMLRQLAAGPGGASTPVVILSTLPRHQVQAEVAAAFAHGQGPYPRVIVRTGSPVSEVDLRAGCAGAAAHVVVLQPDHAEAGAPAAPAAKPVKLAKKKEKLNTLKLFIHIFIQTYRLIYKILCLT
jgi:hypothetical protein